MKNDLYLGFDEWCIDLQQRINIPLPTLDLDRLSFLYQVEVTADDAAEWIREGLFDVWSSVLERIIQKHYNSYEIKR